MRSPCLTVASLWMFMLGLGALPAFARAGGEPAVADIALGARVLEHQAHDGYAESLVRITAVNHGPSDVSSFLVATCLSEPPVIDVDGAIPGGCGDFTLVAPCAEFGLGFRFDAVARGEALQCLVRVRAPLQWSSLELALSASHARDANDDGMYDPVTANDLIVLSAGGLPQSEPVPASSFATLLALCCLLLVMATRYRAEHARAG